MFVKTYVHEFVSIDPDQSLQTHQICMRYRNWVLAPFFKRCQPRRLRFASLICSINSRNPLLNPFTSKYETLKPNTKSRPVIRDVRTLWTKRHFIRVHLKSVVNLFNLGFTRGKSRTHTEEEAMKIIHVNAFEREWEIGTLRTVLSNYRLGG